MQPLFHPRLDISIYIRYGEESVRELLKGYKAMTVLLAPDFDREVRWSEQPGDREVVVARAIGPLG